MMRASTLGPRTLALSVLVSTACYENDKAKGELIASQTIGPEGGTLEGGGVRLVVPAHAVTAETEFELLTSTADLSARDYAQSGGAYALQPADLHLRLPAALSFSGASDDSTVLFVQDGLTVAASGSTAWINELSTFALASEGTPVTTVVEPELGRSPDDAGAAHRDIAHFRVQTSETPRFNIALTIYDVEQYYVKPLNGNGAGDCGFELSTVAGGSLSAICSGGPLTSTIGVSSAEISFDVTPDQAGKMETPVVVGVVGGSDELAYQLGFFSFDTSPCYAENCSNVGTCEVQGDTPVCTCNDGYEPGPELTCTCVPQCGGRECGFDGCDSTCAPGCNEGEVCDDASGTCVPDGSDSEADNGTTTDDPSTTTDDPSTTTTTATTDGGSSSGDPSTGSTTTL
jgi:hypothetical protein